MVQYLLGTKMNERDKRWRDVSCDSNCMDGVMPMVDVEIRATYHWLDFDT